MRKMLPFDDVIMNDINFVRHEIALRHDPEQIIDENSVKVYVILAIPDEKWLSFYVYWLSN